MTSALPGPPLRIAVLGDFDGIHTRRWLEVFVARGHDVHAISYYRPRPDLPGVTLHVLSNARRDGPLRLRSGHASGPSAEGRQPTAPSLAGRLPPNPLRLVHAVRYQRAGLKRTLTAIVPDVFHAHYLVEHGFYGALAGFRPYVVSAWGSDLLVESRKPLGRLIARWTLRRVDLLTANDASLARRAVALGLPEERVRVVHLGTDASFLDAGARSVNLAGADAQPTLISDRALEPLYNVDVVLRAFARLRERLPAARLIVANDGSQRRRLEALAGDLGLGGSVDFRGYLAPSDLAAALAAAHVYVSVPGSDSLALSNLEAMAAGAFPVVADLPSVDGWIDHGLSGLRVPPRDLDALADALFAAFADAGLRRRAAGLNRAKVAAQGLREPNMLVMERLYYRLAGHPISTSI